MTQKASKLPLIRPCRCLEPDCGQPGYISFNLVVFGMVRFGRRAEGLAEVLILDQSTECASKRVDIPRRYQKSVGFMGDDIRHSSDRCRNDSDAASKRFEN